MKIEKEEERMTRRKEERDRKGREKDEKLKKKLKCLSHSFRHI